MSLPVALRPEAAEDLGEAREWYEKKQPGLGDRFVVAADEFFERISSMPEIYATVVKNVRRGKLASFPYIVYYRVWPDRIEILAVLHGSRNSRVWRSRIR